MSAVAILEDGSVREAPPSWPPTGAAHTMVGVFERRDALRVATSDEIRCKGVMFRSTVNALAKLRGQDAADRAQALLSPEMREAMRSGGVVATGWYPIAWLRDLHGAAQRACGAGPQLARAIGYEAAGADFRGVYRFLASLLSPETLISLTPRVWSSYWDGGQTKYLELRKGMSRGCSFGCKGFDRNIWESIIGGSIAILEIGGATNVRMRVVSGGGDGDDSMECEARWSVE